MASETADLQRDLGGAIIQSILGAIPAAGYAASFAVSTAASPQADQNLAHTVGIIIVILGALLVLVCFPRKDREIALLAEYASADAAAANS
jgi:hypothetical protein